MACWQAAVYRGSIISELITQFTDTAQTTVITFLRRIVHKNNQRGAQQIAWWDLLHLLQNHMDRKSNSNRNHQQNGKLHVVSSELYSRNKGWENQNLVQECYCLCNVPVRSVKKIITTQFKLTFMLIIFLTISLLSSFCEIHLLFFSTKFLLAHIGSQNTQPSYFRYGNWQKRTPVSIG